MGHKIKIIKKGGNPPEDKKRKITDISNENLKLEFLNIESLTEAYIDAINEWKEAEKQNNTERLMRISRGTLFTLLIVLGILAYSQPSVLQGLSGEQLKSAVDTEMRKLVSQGISYDNLSQAIKEFSLNVSQIRFTFQNGEPLTASQILDIFKQNDTLQPLIETLERALSIITGSFSEIKGFSSSAFKLLENLSTGQITRQNIGDIAGYGLWSIIIYIGMTFTSTAYSTTKGIASMINKFSTNIVSKDSALTEFIPSNLSEQSLTTPLLLTIADSKHVVTLGDILFTINNRPGGNVNYINSFFDSMLSFIFNHEEDWTMDDSDNNTIVTLKSQFTSDSQTTLSQISKDGYGDEFIRIAEFMNNNFGAQINDAVVLLGENVSLIYGSLFKIVCGRTGLESNESSQMSEISNISEISELTRDECGLVSNITIKQNIVNSLINTLIKDVGELANDNDIKEAAQGLLNLHLNEMNGGKRRNKKNRTKKNKKHITKKKRHIKKKSKHTHKNK